MEDFEEEDDLKWLLRKVTEHSHRPDEFLIAVPIRRLEGIAEKLLQDFKPPMRGGKVIQ